jgi:hypothetical protein
VAAAVDGVSLSGWRCIQAITPVSIPSMVGFQGRGLQMVGRVMLFALHPCSGVHCVSWLEADVFLEVVTTSN